MGSVTSYGVNGAPRMRIVIHKSTNSLETERLGCDHRRVQRFLTLADVAEILNVSAAQAYALVRTGELPAIKVGGRGQWRVETTELERYIERGYAQTAAQIAAMP